MNASLCMFYDLAADLSLLCIHNSLNAKTHHRIYDINYAKQLSDYIVLQCGPVHVCNFLIIHINNQALQQQQKQNLTSTLICRP